MEFNYCAIIDRRTADGYADFTDLPFDDLARLTSVAEAALGIPYVESVQISQKAQEIDGKPWWGRAVFKRRNPAITWHYMSEQQFKQDLRAVLHDDKLFDELYTAKAEYKAMMES